MVSLLDQNHLFGSSLFSKVNEVKEGGLCEFVDWNISKPYEEPLILLIIDTWEVPKGLGTIKSYSGIEIEEFSLVFFYLEEFLKSLRLIYIRLKIG